MQAGTSNEALRRVADRLCAEFANPDFARFPGIVVAPTQGTRATGRLGDEQEALVVRLREALAGIAATLGIEADESSTPAIAVALDGTESVIRGELATGGAERVLRQMPSLVFLVALAVADQDRAIDLSRRTTELIEP